MIPPGSMGSSASLILPLTRHHWLVCRISPRFPFPLKLESRVAISKRLMIIATAGACKGTSWVGSVGAVGLVFGMISGCLVSPLASGLFNPHGSLSIAGGMGASSVASSTSVAPVEGLVPSSTLRVCAYTFLNSATSSFALRRS